jgi:hypothetical protein
MEKSQQNMKEDDSRLVDEILNELNTDNNPGMPMPKLNESNHNTMRNAMPLPNNIPMRSMGQAGMPPRPPLDIQQTIDAQEKPVVQEIEFTKEDSLYETILNKGKKPLIILLLCFIVFNPKVKNKLTEYLPRVFDYGFSTFKQQLGTFILSLIVSILFFVTKFI